MGLFSFLKKANTDEGVERYRLTSGAVLLDVRTPQEYQEGHIPGSQNVPLHQLDTVKELVQDKNTPLFVYCYSGARSGRATTILQRMGYTNIDNIGGITAYSGKVEQ